MTIKLLTLITLLLPLLGAMIAGFGAKKIGPRGAHVVTILLMSLSLITSLMIFKRVVLDGDSFYGSVYTWALSGNFHFEMGFMIDSLTAVMMLVVVFISLLVHIYSIGYMAGDPGDQRFFSYMSLFTFAMLLLVSANNFLQLFFGWEGVGLVSYLLIGFWFTKEAAAQGSLKAFLVNRVGDFGFILGIAAILDFVGTLDYHEVFTKISELSTTTISIFPNTHWSIITVIAILLFIGAMGKSAQMPLHVWLPESMQGPTPISALIHAATMVTAGVFMVARMSPIFELSTTALSVVLVVGATTALFTGLLAFVEFDIKKVIAFSTMSQLGYMIAADGASAYSAGIFHLLTHASFKALLFLAAGSVIIAMHHEQDMRKMGNLKKYLPTTYITFLIGALALAAIPPFSGFYSKDPIIDAVQHSLIPGARYAYVVLLIGTFVTGYYIFRAFFMVFHSAEKVDIPLRSKIKETPWSMRAPLIALAIPSLFLGAGIINWILFEKPGLLGASIIVTPAHNVLGEIAASFHGAWHMAAHAIAGLPFWFSLAGIASAWFAVIALPKLPVFLRRFFPWLYWILVEKYGFDAFNSLFFVRGSKSLSQFFYKVADEKLIDHVMVDGTGRNTTRIARLIRRLQSGYLYHYVFIMIIALLGFLVWLVLVE